MFQAVFIYPDMITIIFDLEVFDEKIIEFLKFVSDVKKDTNFLVFEGSCIYRSSNNDIFFCTVDDIPSFFDVFDSDLYKDEVRKKYLEICKHIEENYINSK